MASKAAKKKQNLEMFDALESTINRVTDQAQRFRRKMDELVSKLLLSLWDLSPQLQKLFLPPLKKTARNMDNCAIYKNPNYTQRCAGWRT